MTEISKRFEQILKTTQKRLYDQGALLPVKTSDGILVGNAKIISNESLKDIWFNDKIYYKNIALNESAIKIANILACRKSMSQADKIYSLDQQYLKHFTDCTIYLEMHDKSKKTGDQFKTELFWIRYQESKYHADYHKERISRLSIF